MADQAGNVHRIDPVARSAARDSVLMQMHKEVMNSHEDEGELEGPSLHHRLAVVVVRDEVSDALRAVADWMDEHTDMLVEGVTVEYHRLKDGREAAEIRMFVDYR